MMTILILFQQSHYRTFKAYCTEYGKPPLTRAGFPTLVSYQRFVELMPTLLVPLVAYLHTQLGQWVPPPTVVDNSVFSPSL
jgi:hypothetical protein